jgi:transcriptional regulator of arginine metabolism
LSGNANTAGMAVDQMHFSQVLGTIAGDDTLLIVAKSNSDAEFIVKSLRMLCFKN